MGKPLKIIVKEAMNDRKMGVQDLADATGIPAARIYKWYSNNRPANPKEADSKILEKWLEESSKSSTAQEKPEEEKQSISQLAEAGLINAKSMAKLVAMLEEKEAVLKTLLSNSNQTLSNQYSMFAAHREYQVYLIEELAKSQGKNTKGTEVVQKLHQKAARQFLQMQRHGIRLAENNKDT